MQRQATRRGSVHRIVPSGVDLWRQLCPAKDAPLDDDDDDDDERQAKGIASLGLCHQINAITRVCRRQHPLDLASPSPIRATEKLKERYQTVALQDTRHWLSVIYVTRRGCSDVTKAAVALQVSSKPYAAATNKIRHLVVVVNYDWLSQTAPAPRAGT